jgi:hypothetical protein
MQKGRSVILGIFVSNFIGMLIIWFSKFLMAQLESSIKSDYSGFFIFSDFIIIPILMGIICAFFWRNLRLPRLQHFLFTAIAALLAIGLSYLFLGEGIICLIIVSPLLCGMALAGSYVGRAMFKRNNNTLNASVIGTLFFLFVIDCFSKHYYENKVVDTIVVNAPPSEVWKYVAEYEPIKKKSDYWLFRAGMPSPVASTVDSYCQGAGRKCIFSNGYVFDEIMTVYKPNEELTFDITHQPRDPEIMGHIDILRGQFLLKDNGDGTTTLTGTSWYRLYVFPTWYYDLWAESLTRNVHLRVMEQIKYLSEHKGNV